MTQHFARRVVLAIGALAVVLTGIVAAPAPQAQAADIAGWDAGYIISDELFYDGNAMAEADVAWFLRNANQSPCAAGYTCLKDYTASTWTRPANPNCGQYNGGGVETAAAIITKVGKACGISQKVLIVLLQKEQSLVTHTSPTPGRYGAAMGFACPDTAPCDAEYYGFYNQVYKAAWQFKRYGNPPGTSNFFTWIPVGKVSQIYYNPNVYCGASAVLIRNAATAALYYYTPYQPNASALANLYGTGDECGSYGNRNFWRLYSDWFGSPNGTEGSYLQLLYQDVFGRAPEDAAKSFWLGAMRNGTSRYDVATGLLASPEYRTQIINANYQEFLGRAPEPSGLSFWLQALANGSLRTDELRLDFLASEEFYNNCGRSQDCFVNAMFESLLGRPAPPEALAYYAGTGDTAWRKLTMSNIYRSPESVGIRVSAMYQKYLGRAPGPSDQAYWLGPVQAGGDPVMLKGIFGGLEYDARAKLAFPNG